MQDPKTLEGGPHPRAAQGPHKAKSSPVGVANLAQSAHYYSGVARPQDVEGSGMAGPGETGSGRALPFCAL
jgi:hypothetical protein